MKGLGKSGFSSNLAIHQIDTDSVNDVCVDLNATFVIS